MTTLDHKFDIILNSLIAVSAKQSAQYDQILEIIERLKRIEQSISLYEPAPLSQ